MTATDDLRRMLDERGVKYCADDGKIAWITRWYFGKYSSAMLTEYDNGECVFVTSGHMLTPEQAIAATLGAGECHDEGGIGSKYPAAFICSECGWSSTVFAFGGNMPQFCPECGRKVKR